MSGPLRGEIFGLTMYASTCVYDILP